MNQRVLEMLEKTNTELQTKEADVLEARINLQAAQKALDKVQAEFDLYVAQIGILIDQLTEAA